MAFTKKLLVLLEDNRVVDGDPETAQSMRRINDNSQHALLKKTLNVAFLSTGVLLLLSVIAVVIFTAFLDDPAVSMVKDQPQSQTRVVSSEDFPVFKSLEIKPLGEEEILQSNNLNTEEREFYEHQQLIPQQRSQQNLRNLQQIPQQITQQKSQQKSQHLQQNSPEIFQRQRHRKHNNSINDYTFKHTNTHNKHNKHNKNRKHTNNFNLENSNVHLKDFSLNKNNKQNVDVNSVTYSLDNVDTENRIHRSHHKHKINHQNKNQKNKKYSKKHFHKNNNQYKNNQRIYSNLKNDPNNNYHNNSYNYTYNNNPSNYSQENETNNNHNNYNLNNNLNSHNFNNPINNSNNKKRQNNYNKQTPKPFNCSLVMMQRGTKQRLVCLGNCPC